MVTNTFKPNKKLFNIEKYQNKEKVNICLKNKEIWSVFDVLSDKMDLLLADNIGYDVWEVEDIPSTAESIVILGKTYKYKDLDEIRDDVQSRLW